MYVLTGQHTIEFEVKKSRFIGIACPVKSPEHALELVASLRHHKATHNTWAYKVGKDYRFNDDGEVGGTAGRPIWSVIEQQDVDQVLVMVIRYYGGTKLGTGGLLRAYSKAAAECLRQAPKTEVRPMVTAIFALKVNDVGLLHAQLSRHKARKLAEDYDGASLTVTVEVEVEKLPGLQAALTAASKGRITLTAAVAPQ